MRSIPPTLPVATATCRRCGWKTPFTMPSGKSAAEMLAQHQREKHDPIPTREERHTLGKLLEL